MNTPGPADNVPAWDDGAALALPRLAEDIDVDACVVGLGGSGLTVVHELLTLGQRAIGIDAGTVGGGAAGRNGGFLLAGTAQFHHDAAAVLGRERARAIYQLTLDEIDRIAARIPTIVRRTGSLRIAANEAEEADCALQLATMRADGFRVEPYRGAEGTGLLFPDDAAFDPLARCRELARSAVARGAQLFEHTPALACEPGIVRTPSGTIRCRRTIVAVDGRLEMLLPELTGRVRTARLQMLGTAPADDVNIPRPVYRRWGYDYWQQRPDRSIVLGGVRDEFVDAEWTDDATPTPELQTRLDALLRRVVGTEAPVVHRWAASVSYSSTILPVLAEVRPHVWAIGGYSGTGNVLGALYGRIVAQLAVTGASAIAAPFIA